MGLFEIVLGTRRVTVSALTYVDSPIKVYGIVSRPLRSSS